MNKIKELALVNFQEIKTEQLHALVVAISAELQQLSADNFSAVGDNLAQYGFWLYTYFKKSQHPLLAIAIKTLESHLQRIKVLTNVNSLQRIDKVYQEFRLINMQVGQMAAINNIPGLFVDRYFRFRINRELQDPNIDPLAIVEWLLRMQPEYAAAENYSVVVKTGVIAFDDGQYLCRFLTSFARDAKYRIMAMEKAIKIAHIPLIKALLAQKICQLPANIALYEVLIPCLIAAKEWPLLAKIEALFGLEILFDYALSHYDFKIAQHYLSKVKLPADIYQFKKVVAIAACCGDIEFINQILAKYPGDNSAFYRQTVTPHYQPQLEQKGSQDVYTKSVYGEDQDRYRFEFNRMVGVLCYFKKQGLFTHSLLAEQQRQELFGPLRAGQLRKIMAYSVDPRLKNYSFGNLRDGINNTSPASEKMGDYFQRCREFFDRLATYNPDDINNIDPAVQLYNYVICVDLKPNYPDIQLTRYRGTLEQGVLEWSHTEPKFFQALLNYIEACSKTLSQLSEKRVIAAEQLLRGLAKIQYYLAQGNIYDRGSSAVCELIAHADFRLANLLHPVETHYRSDCLALAMIEEKEFVNYYPKIFGVATYEELIVLLSAPFVTYQQQDRIAYDARTNAIILFSTLQKKYFTKKDSALPNVNTVLRRAAAFSSVEQLQQVLFFVTDLDQADVGESKSTALHWAVIKGKLDNAQLLIAAGASPDIPDAKLKTARDYAAESKDHQMQSVFANKVIALK